MQWDAGRGPDEKDSIENFCHIFGFQEEVSRAHVSKSSMILSTIWKQGEYNIIMKDFEKCIQSGDLLLETKDVVLIY